MFIYGLCLTPMQALLQLNNLEIMCSQKMLFVFIFCKFSVCPIFIFKWKAMILRCPVSEQESDFLKVLFIVSKQRNGLYSIPPLFAGVYVSSPPANPENY